MSALGVRPTPCRIKRSHRARWKPSSGQLVHMNGRVYDYALGKFLSVDPFIQFPLNSQSLNPYSYVLNNPLSGTDPTGYCEASVGTHVCGVEAVGTETSATGSHLPTGGFGNESAGTGKKNDGDGGQGAKQNTQPTASVQNQPASGPGLHSQNNGEVGNAKPGDDSGCEEVPEACRDRDVAIGRAKGTADAAGAVGNAANGAAVQAVKAAPWFFIPELGIAKKLGVLGRWLLGRSEKTLAAETAEAVGMLGATPNLLKTQDHLMSRQAVSQIAGMSGTTAAKAAEYERLGAQISAHSKSGWGMSRMLGTDGSISYVGTGGADYMTTIDAEGRVFSGHFGNGMARSGTQFTPIYSELREVK